MIDWQRLQEIDFGAVAGAVARDWHQDADEVRQQMILIVAERAARDEQFLAQKDCYVRNFAEWRLRDALRREIPGIGNLPPDIELPTPDHQVADAGYPCLADLEAAVAALPPDLAAMGRRLLAEPSRYVRGASRWASGRPFVNASELGRAYRHSSAWGRKRLARLCQALRAAVVAY
jgi:hypothetical protein